MISLNQNWSLFLETAWRIRQTVQRATLFFHQSCAYPRAALTWVENQLMLYRILWRGAFESVPDSYILTTSHSPENLRNLCVRQSPHLSTGEGWRHQHRGTQIG